MLGRAKVNDRFWPIADVFVLTSSSQLRTYELEPRRDVAIAERCLLSGDLRPLVVVTAISLIAGYPSSRRVPRRNDNSLRINDSNVQ